MYLENGRDIVRGILILVFAAVAVWVDRSTGIALVAFMGIMILQSAFTDWCPADLFLRPIGMKKKNGAHTSPERREHTVQAGS